MARYKKSIINSLWVHWTLVTCYVPIAEVTALILILGLNLFLLVALASAVASVNLNSLLNPIIYRWKIKEVRSMVTKMHDRTVFHFFFSFFLLKGTAVTPWLAAQEFKVERKAHPALLILKIIHFVIRKRCITQFFTTIGIRYKYVLLLRSVESGRSLRLINIKRTWYNQFIFYRTYLSSRGLFPCLHGLT